MNADVVAGHIAAAIGAHKVVFLTDVDGLYEDFDDKSTLVSNMTLSEVKAMLAEGRVSMGMIPKLSSCVRALEAGVHRAHILNGTTPHALLLELLTDKGVGTMITQGARREAARELRVQTELGCAARRAAMTKAPRDLRMRVRRGDRERARP